MTRLTSVLIRAARTRVTGRSPRSRRAGTSCADGSDRCVARRACRCCRAPPRHAGKRCRLAPRVGEYVVDDLSCGVRAPVGGIDGAKDDERRATPTRRLGDANRRTAVWRAHEHRPCAAPRPRSRRPCGESPRGSRCGSDAPGRRGSTGGCRVRVPPRRARLLFREAPAPPRRAGRTFRGSRVPRAPPRCPASKATGRHRTSARWPPGARVRARSRAAPVGRGA